MSAKDLAGAVRSALRRVADPTKAAPMQAYAKSSMPYLGVTTPERRAVCREVFAEVDFSTAATWRRAALGLWRGARFREERYCAIDLTGVRRFDRYQDMAALPMYEEMVYAVIEPALGSKEFFLRKAIGWALRQYAWTDPKEVRRCVLALEGRLSGLSRREALKNVGPGGRGQKKRRRTK